MKFKVPDITPDLKNPVTGEIVSTARTNNAPASADHRSSHVYAH